MNDSVNSSWQSTFQEIGRPLVDTTFVVIDLETTGGAPHLGAGITEIGAVKICRGEVVAEFETFIDPGHPIPSYITDLTGITDEMVFQSPTIAAVFPSLLEFLGSPEKTVLVAQNAPFDLSFLTYAARVNAFPWPKFPVLDTAIIARKVLTRDEVPNCKLGTLAQFFGTETTPNHRALDDAHSTVAVLHGLFERLGGFEVDTVEKLFEFFGDKKKRLREKIPKEF